MTALLFAAGKYLIGLYLGRTSVGSAYGAAGSFVVVLLWVYYSCWILFFGAELIQAYVRHQGREVAPDAKGEKAASEPDPAKAVAKRKKR